MRRNRCNDFSFTPKMLTLTRLFPGRMNSIEVAVSDGVG